MKRRFNDEHYREWLRQLSDVSGDFEEHPDFQLDNEAPVRRSRGGAWVKAWVWVSDDEAEIVADDPVIQERMGGKAA